MKKIILKYLKSNSKKLVLIVSGFHFLGPRFGGPPKSNGGRKTFERQINKYKNWKETVCAGEPVCIHRSWVESAYAILGRSEVLFPRCVRWSFVERSKPISLFLSQSSLPVLLLILVNGRWFVLSHSHFFSLQTYAVLLHFWWFVLVVCASKLWGWSWVGSVLVCLVLMLFVLGN